MGKVQEHKRAQKSKRQTASVIQDVNKADRFEIAGMVRECLPNTMFRVEITSSTVAPMVGRVLLGTLIGRMRLYRIRVMPGDYVKGYVSKYDLNKCKITYRSTKKPSQ